MGISKKVFIEYKVSEILSSAYSVTLSSQDSSYGIKKQDGTVVVPDSTLVTNSSTGVYEYNFDVEDGVIYVVSWKIISSFGEQPVYAVQNIGPFYSVTKSFISSVADKRGSFITNTTGTLFLSLTDIHGNPITANSIKLTISKDGTEVVSSVIPDYIKPGFYALDWTVPSNFEAGEYLVTWEYSADGFSGIELQSIVVSSSGNTSSSLSNIYGSIMSDLRAMLTEFICCAQKIPVYHEEGIPDANYQKYKFTFARWNQAYGTRIYRNNILVENGVEINYFKGFVVFDEPLTSYDIVHADYNFRWFTDEQLDAFIGTAMAMINLYPPQGSYNVTNIPGVYVPMLLYAAARDAIRNLLMCLNFQQPQQVFGGSDAAQKAISNMESLKKNYEEDLNAMLEQKKFGKYPRIKTITVPEFTLPGGRSRWFRYMFGGGS